MRVKLSLQQFISGKTAFLFPAVGPIRKKQILRTWSFLPPRSLLQKRKARLIGRPPVSYTHLDVYKRQSLGSRPFRAYSKGLKRRLTIAAALIHHPRILFLDEPTTGIDVESARQIRRLILDLKRSGTTVFLTTHYIEEAERLCDRVAFFFDPPLN